MTRRVFILAATIAAVPTMNSMGSRARPTRRPAGVKADAKKVTPGSVCKECNQWVSR